jgi:hypothetical protein
MNEIKRCVECRSTKLTTETRAWGELVRCSKCRAIMNENWTSKQDYRCDVNGNKI